MTTYPTRTPGHGRLLRAALLGLLLTAAAAIGVALGLLPGSPGGAHPHAAPGRGPGHGRPTGVPAHLQAGPDHPNIVFVLTDDLSMDLLPYMPQVRQLQSQGTSFDNYFVSDSLCCPSRSSI